MQMVRRADVYDVNALVLQQLIERDIPMPETEAIADLGGSRGRASENALYRDAETAECFEVCPPDKSQSNDRGA
jgi:hypothetical protein